MAYVKAARIGFGRVRRRLGLGALVQNSDGTFGVDTSGPNFNWPGGLMQPAGPLVTCPDGSQVFYSDQCPVPLQSNCTCVNNKCVENGNDCVSSVAAQAPYGSPATNPAQWGYGQQGCPFYSRPYDNTGGVTVDASGRQTAGGKGCISVFNLYPLQFALGFGLLFFGLLAVKR